MTTKLKVFTSKGIRKILFENEWWFVVEDIMRNMGNGFDPRISDSELAKRWREIVRLFPMDNQTVECVNGEGLFRLVQSLPSAKVEPIRRWLAKVASERVAAILNPERGCKRSGPTGIDDVFAMLAEVAPEEVVRNARRNLREKTRKAIINDKQ